VSAFNRLLVPLDGSPRAEVALRWVHLLPSSHVRLIRICAEGDPGETEAARYLRETAAPLCPPDREIETRVTHGGPAEAIVADATDVDLIVMCTEGAGGGGRRLYGSVADRVARHAPVPTLLLRGGYEPVATAPLRRIVVPLDGSPAAERAIPVATALVGMLGVGVHLLTVSDRPETDEESLAHTETAETSAQADDTDGKTARTYLACEAAKLRERELSVSTEHRTGDPAAELLAGVGPGDLLVLTTHGRGTARRWQIGTVAERLLRHATAPVVIVRADAE
jgi:nucleotide-binding universal stress UspA family protein